MELKKEVLERLGYLGAARVYKAVGITALTIVLLWSFTLGHIQTERNDALEAEVQKNSNLAQSHQERASYSFALLDQTLLFLRAEYLSDGARRGLRPQLQALQLKQKFVSDAALIDPQGLAIANTATALSPNYADREYFKFHAENPADVMLLGKPIVGKISGKWVMTASRRINRPDGSFGGVVRISVNAEYFAKDYAKTNHGAHSAMALIGLDGITWARRNGDKISFGEDIRASQLFKELPKAANGHYIAAAASDGVRRVVSYRSLVDYPMVVIVGSSVEDVLATTRENEFVYLASSALITVAILFFALYFLFSAARRAEANQNLLELERRHRAAVEQSNAELRRMGSLLESTGELAQVGGWEVDLQTMKLTWTRETFRIAGMEPPNEPPLEDGINLFAPEARPAMSAAVQAAMESAKPYDLELPIITGNGQHKWVRTQGFAEVHDGKVTRIYGSFQDITARINAEQDMRALAERLTLAIRAGGVGIWDWDLINNVLVWDDAMYALYGVSKDAFKGAYDAWLSGVHPDDQARGDQEAQAALRGEKDYDTEYRIVWPSGEIRNIRALATVERDDTGRALRMVGTNWDITRQKSTEAALETSVKDKEALLKEVHHRVKNNLQVITSLLRLESRRSAVPEVVDLLKAMQGRVYAMAQLHESLYRSGTFASIDLALYLRRIAEQTFQTHRAEGQSVRLILELESVQAGMDQAVSCGLLVTELVSNSLKHGFPQGRAGEVRVTLLPVDTQAPATDALWRLQVRDTGTGLPPDFEERRQDSLGLQLAGDLSIQAGGKLIMSTEPGAGVTFEVVMKVLSPAALVMPP